MGYEAGREEMKAFIYVHELIENSGGIWLGCPDEKVVRDSYTEGETGTEVIALVKLSDAEARIEELETVLSKFVNWTTNEAGTKSLGDDVELWELAEKVLENKQ